MACKGDSIGGGYECGSRDKDCVCAFLLSCYDKGALGVLLAVCGFHV